MCINLVYSQSMHQEKLYELLSEEAKTAVEERNYLMERLEHTSKQEQTLLNHQSKSAGNILLQLDSLYSEGLYVVNFLYDANGRTTEEVQRTYNPMEQAYINNTRRTWIFNDDEMASSRLSQVWSMQELQWINSELEEENYNDEGQILSRQFSIWDSSSDAWIAQSATEWEYEDAMPSEVISYSPIAGILTPDTRTTYTYEDGLIIEVLTESYDPGDEVWKLELRRTSTYTDQVLSTELFESWSEALLSWEPTQWREYAYKANSENILGFVWNEPEGSWEEQSLTEIILDASGNRIHYLSQIKEDEQWRPVWQEDLEYDEENNRTATLFYTWNTFTLALEPLVGYNFEIDWNYASDEIAWMMGQNGQANIFHKIDASEMTQYTSGGLIVNQIQTLFFYSPFSFLHTDSETVSPINLYPNPSDGLVYLNSEAMQSPMYIELFDMQGRKVHDRLIPSNGSIRIDHLQKGLYVYRISAGDHVHTGKLMRK